MSQDIPEDRTCKGFGLLSFLGLSARVVVAAGVGGQLAQQLAGDGVDDSDGEVVDEHDDVGSGGGSSADVAEGGPVWQRSVGSAVVVYVDELAQQGLELGDRGWLIRPGAEPLLERLLESFDLALGGGVVRFAILLGDVEVAELGLAAALASDAGEADGGGTFLHEVLGGKSDCQVSFGIDASNRM
jgi:hypothetical protein